ncbi:MAG: universal stress protein [Chloroflexi bacterium]|nr:universal stress protein [Chloroflexota bacterium]
MPMNTITETDPLKVGGDAHSGSMPTTVLVPMLNVGVATELLQLAGALAAGFGAPRENERLSSHPVPYLPHLVVLSVVEVPAGQPLSMGLDMARSYRALLDFLPSQVAVGDYEVRIDRIVKVARDVPTALQQAVIDEQAGMVLLHWKGYAREPKHYSYGRIIDALVKNPPCDLIVARAESWQKSRRILLPVRGGPGAERALQLSISLAESLQVPLSVMHNVSSLPQSDPKGNTAIDTTGDEPYIIFDEHLERAQKEAGIEVERILTVNQDPLSALLAEAKESDFVIMGAPPHTGSGKSHDAPIPLKVSQVKGPPLLLLRSPEPLDLAGYAREVRSRRPKRIKSDMPSEAWFVENTYDCDEFKDPVEFLKTKKATGFSLSIALLTMNDARHIHSIITGLKRVLVEMHPVADQIVVVDAGSDDGTVEIARDLGVEVYNAGEILPEEGVLHGRGESWWKSLGVLRGDIVVWLDPKARRFHPGAALSLAGPLMRVPTLRFVTAFALSGSKAKNEQSGKKREVANPLDGEGFEKHGLHWGEVAVPRRNGDALSEQIRVQSLRPSDLESMSATQIAALPPAAILQVLDPSLAGVISPFSRDVAGRRTAMLALPAFIGENFEIGLLLSAASKFGTRAIAQVELRHAQPAPSPQPGLRRSLDVLQLLAFRLPDARMRKVATEIGERVQRELQNKSAPAQSDPTGPLFEVRALAPIERPPHEGSATNP